MRSAEPDVSGVDQMRCHCIQENVHINAMVWEERQTSTIQREGCMKNKNTTSSVTDV